MLSIGDCYHRSLFARFLSDPLIGFAEKFEFLGIVVKFGARYANVVNYVVLCAKFCFSC